MPKEWKWSVDLDSATGTITFPRQPKPRVYPYDAGFLTDASENFREARAGLYSIWIVSPPGYGHSRCFEEVALGLQSAFLDLGYRVPVVSDPALASGRVVVFGPHLLSRVPETSWPADMILYNLEQVSGESKWMTEGYRALLKRHSAWDYSPENIEALSGMGISGVTLCPIGFAEVLRRIQPAADQDIDVLFIGSINERRRTMLKSLRASGIGVRWGFDVYGGERDQLLARAKLILNMHMYDAKVFEIVRVSYLLANRMCVVSETSLDPRPEARFRDGVAFAAADDLPEACARLLGDQEARRKMRDEGFRIFSSMPQRDYLRAALENVESNHG